MTKLLFTQQWPILLLGFAILAFFAWRRRRDQHWIATHFPNRPILVQSFAVQYFGRVTESGKPRASKGFLVLFPDLLIFRSPAAKREFRLQVSAIRKIYHARDHKGVDLERSLMKLDFVAEDKQEDTAAFAVPYPPQWMQAIEKAVSFCQQAERL